MRLRRQSRLLLLATGLGLLVLGCGEKQSATGEDASESSQKTDSRVRMGLALLSEGHVDAAMEQLRRLAEEGGERIAPGEEPKWAFPVVQQLLARRRLDVADSLLNSAGQLSQRSSGLRYLSANLLGIEGRVDEALDAYAAVDGDSSLTKRVRHETASLLLKAGRDEAALAAADEALALAPGDPALHLLKAEAFRRLGRPDQALAECRSVAPGSDRWVMEGEIYLNGLDRPDTARVLFDRALQDTPAIPNVRFLLGRALLGEGNATRALKALEPLARRQPPFPDSRAALVECYRALGRTESADSLQARIDEDTTREKWHQLRAQGLQQSADGQLEAALASFDAALEIADKNANLHNDRGAVLARLQRWDEAEREFLEAARIDPQDPTFQENLARLYYRTGDEAKQNAAVARWTALTAAADSLAKVDKP